MKKTFIAFLSVAFALGFVSCQKEQTVVIPIDGDTTPAVPTEPTYQEGVYAPLMKIASIDREEATSETWTWTGDLLTSVTTTEGGTRQFTYDNKRLVRATGSESGIGADATFAYNGDQMVRCVASNSGTDVMMLSFSHANGRINGADIALDAEYISSMLDGLFPMGKGKHVDPIQILLDTTDNSARIDLTWDGKNVSQLRVTGDIPFQLSKEMYEALKPYLPVDQSILSLIDFYFMVSNALPMQIVVSDTIDYTYDTKINPFFCYFGDIDPTCLSLNNVLSATTHGSVAINVTLTQNPMQVFSQPIDDRKVYFYEYNDRNYPTMVEGSDNYTITYKQ